MRELGIEAETAAERVLQMRDDFLQLVQAFNAVGNFDEAIEAQALRDCAQ